MAIIGTKGYYVSALKEVGITHIEGKKLETYKGSFLANYFDNHVKSKKKRG